MINFGTSTLVLAYNGNTFSDTAFLATPDEQFTEEELYSMFDCNPTKLIAVPLIDYSNVVTRANHINSIIELAETNSLDQKSLAWYEV